MSHSINFNNFSFDPVELTKERLIHSSNTSDAEAQNQFGHLHIFDNATSSAMQFAFAGVLLLFVSIFGMLGNFLSILVLTQKQIHASLTVLLIGLSACDLFVCVLYIVVRGLPITLKYFEIGTPYLLWICVAKKYVFPILQTVQLGSTYFTVAITIERFIAVFRPLQSRSLCTKTNSIYATVAIVLIAVSSNSLMFYMHLKRNEQVVNSTCISKPPDYIPEYLNHIRLGLYVLIHYLIPLVTVVVINAMIVKKIHANNKKRENLTQNQQKEIKLTNMLIAVVLVYVICNIFRVINSFTNNVFGITFAELVALTDFLVVFNSAINYLIYCAYGKEFRQSFSTLLGCKRNSSSIQNDERNLESEVIESSFVKSVRKMSSEVKKIPQIADIMPEM